MRKVLIVTYKFPPMDCGVGRVVKLVKYLPRHGWAPVVLTARKAKLFPAYDDLVLADIPADIKVARTYSLENRFIAFRVPSFFGKRANQFFVPDVHVGWIPFAFLKGLELLLKERIDLIFSTSKPHAAHFVAYLLNKFTGIPWVADFRDEWTSNLADFPDSRCSEMHRRSEKMALRADRVTAVTVSIIERLKQYSGSDTPGKFRVICHGYDPDDFFGHAGSGGLKTFPALRGNFVLTHTGDFYGTRQPVTFIEAVMELAEEVPEFKSKVKVQLVGPKYRIEPICRKMATGGMVILIDRVSHREAWTYLQNSDVQLLFVGTDRTHVAATPGKLFEYLAIGNPILALAPEGEASQIIRETRSGVIVHPEDKLAIKQALLRLYQDSCSGIRNFCPDREQIEKYDVRKSVFEFAKLFDELVLK